MNTLAWVFHHSLAFRVTLTRSESFGGSPPCVLMKEGGQLNPLRLRLHQARVNNVIKQDICSWQNCKPFHFCCIIELGKSINVWEAREGKERWESKRDCKTEANQAAHFKQLRAWLEAVCDGSQTEGEEVWRGGWQRKKQTEKMFRVHLWFSKKTASCVPSSCVCPIC